MNQMLGLPVELYIDAASNNKSRKSHALFRPSLPTGVIIGCEFEHLSPGSEHLFLGFRTFISAS